MIANDISNLPTCPKCGVEVQGTDRYCGHCGSELIAEKTQSNEDVFSLLTPSLAYFFITLALLSTYKLTSLFPDDFEGFLTVTVIDMLIVIAFGLYAYRDIKHLFSFSGFRFSIAGMTVIAALAGSVFISWLADIINVSISDDVFYNTYLFQETNAPFLFATLFICVQPALFEELAFRGFLFNNIQQLSSPAATVYITGFIFGIIHLAVISMLWLVPIGIVLAYMRLKYNTLWYGVIGHFTYNFGITLIEFIQLSNLD